MGPELKELISYVGKLPGLGPRSARRAVLHLMKHRSSMMAPLKDSLTQVMEKVRDCQYCGNLDSIDPCAICCDSRRDRSTLCVVADVSDLWALERSGFYNGLYHVLGGTLSAMDGIGPEDLRIGGLVSRASDPAVTEIILALNATVDGQTTAHYLVDCLASVDVRISGLAHGVPVGGELDYLDDGTLSMAMQSRKVY
ncbi:MAG: recombination mediator RecR [Alphaproteobacteria bacterium]